MIWWAFLVTFLHDSSFFSVQIPWVFLFVILDSDNDSVHTSTRMTCTQYDNFSLTSLVKSRRISPTVSVEVSFVKYTLSLPGQGLPRDCVARAIGQLDGRRRPL